MKGASETSAASANAELSTPVLLLMPEVECGIPFRPPWTESSAVSDAERRTVESNTTAENEELKDKN